MESCVTPENRTVDVDRLIEVALSALESSDDPTTTLAKLEGHEDQLTNRQRKILQRIWGNFSFSRAA